MQIPAACEGTLLVCSPEGNARVDDCLREASDAYQRARRRFDLLTLAGRGAGAAYCLLLAARFMPESVVIAPVTEEGLEPFLRVVRGSEHRLFAVCASVTVLLPDGVSLGEKRKIKRLMRLMHGPDKQLRVLPGEREIQRCIKSQTNSHSMIKTLA